MKVCQVCAVDFTLQKFLLPLIDGMSKEGWEVISVCSPGGFVEEMTRNGYEISTIPISRSLNIFSHTISLIRLIILFRKEKFDLVHLHTPVAALLGRMAARLSGVPLIVYTAHGFYFHDDMPGLKRRIWVALERFAGKFTDILFTQSEEDALTAKNEKIIHPDKVFSIGNGVDVNVFNPTQIGEQPNLKKMLGIPYDAFVIGMIARLVKEKGVIEFLDAAIKLHRENKNISFVLVGERLVSDHAEDVSTSIQIAQKQLGNKLVLTGLRQDVPELIAAMDVFCLPSWREGMPRTIIEAMMMSKPVVATDIRGSREEVVDNETGLLVPVRDSELLAAALKKVVDCPGFAKKLGENGRGRALKYFDERKIVANQIKLIREHLK